MRNLLIGIIATTFVTVIAGRPAKSMADPTTNNLPAGAASAPPAPTPTVAAVNVTYDSSLSCYNCI